MKIINLLPKQKQQELKDEAIYHSLASLVWVSVASFVLVFAAQFATKLYLQHRAGTIQSDINQLQQAVNRQDNSKIKTQITAVNNVVGDFDALAAAAPQWSGLIKAFTPLPPPGVHVLTLNVNVADRSVIITGFSPTRDLVIQLYNNILSDTDHFYGIDYPLENVSKPSNVNFHFTFFVKASVLQ